MKILVVDDNAIVRSGLKAILTQVDSVTSVMEAGDAFSALEMNSSVAADIVLLDINMPGRSGLEILPDLATSSAVIMLTSNDDPYAIKQALDAGAKGYLVHGQLGTNEIVGAIETCKHGGLVCRILFGIVYRTGRPKFLI